MPIFKLTDWLSVDGVITRQDVPHLATEGFTAIVCNRPDDEACGQSSMDEIEAACNAAGLLFIRYPVNAMNFPGPDLEGLAELFDDSTQSVLAYCRTGTRCANLWVASRAKAERLESVNVARAIGFDLSMVVR